MTLTDIAPLERWVALEKDVNAKSGLDVNVFNTKGYRISDLKNWANDLCPEIKATDKGQSFICAPAHMNIAAMAAQTKQTVIEECDAGMLKMVVPILMNDNFIGAVGACGLLLDDAEIEDFLVNKTTDIAEEKIEKLSQGIRSITTDNAETLGRYIETQVAEIIAESVNNSS